MRVVVIYQSKTGFSEYYAKAISKKCNFDIYELKKINIDLLKEYDVFIYGGGIYAGIINGFKKFKAMYDRLEGKRLIMFAVGAMPADSYARIEKMWRANLKEGELKAIKHFYLQGGIAYDKLSFMSKHLMKMFANNMYKKDKTHDLRESFNYTSERAIEPIINYLKGKK